MARPRMAATVETKIQKPARIQWPATPPIASATTWVSTQIVPDRREPQEPLIGRFVLDEITRFGRGF